MYLNYAVVKLGGAGQIYRNADLHSVEFLQNAIHTKNIRHTNGNGTGFDRKVYSFGRKRLSKWAEYGNHLAPPDDQTFTGL